MAKYPVRSSCDDEAAEEVDSVDIGRTHWDMLSDCPDKSNNVDEDTCNVGCVPSPVETGGEVVWRCLLGGVEVSDLQVAAADKVVVEYDDTGDRG